MAIIDDTNYSLTGAQVKDVVSKIKAKADASDLPTKVSDLTNDSNFQTGTEVDTKISTALSSVLTYKGTKANYSDLPVSGNKTGDVWNITNADSQHGIKAGDNVAYNGEGWDVLGGTIDLSDYLTASQIADAYVAKEQGKGLSSNDYTDAEKSKLSGIETGAEANVQSDWNESDNTKDSYIKNKPTIPDAQVNSDWNAVSGVAQILNKPTIPAAQVNSDWNAVSGVAQILNKPTLPSSFTTSEWESLWS